MSDKRAYDSTHKDVAFKEGQLVMVHHPIARPGLSPTPKRKWDGPYRILEQVSPVNFRIRHVDTGKSMTVHVQRLSPFVPREPVSSDRCR